MSYILVSDRPAEGFAEFLLEAANELSKYKVKGLAVVALLDQPPEEDISSMTGYWHMSLRDKEMAAADIQADVTADIIRTNLKAFLQEEEEREDGQE